MNSIFRLLSSLLLVSSLTCSFAIAQTVSVSIDDRNMNRALNTARTYLPKVLPLVERLGPKSEQLGFKVLIRPAKNGASDQYVWVDQVKKLKGNQYQGRLLNEVAAFKSYRKGKRIKFTTNSIGDWYLVIDSNVYGEFSTRVIREMLPKHERRQFDYLSNDPVPPGW